jgi:predicted nucleic acid-binding protein
VRTAIDTNVISALWSSEPLASEMAVLLGNLQTEGGLVVCAPVFTELLAHPKADSAFVEEFLSRTHITIEFGLEEVVWREAGRCFSAYAERRRQSGGGEPRRLLIDFLVGAHAIAKSDRLLTLDPGRYRQAFPGLRVLP